MTKQKKSIEPTVILNKNFDDEFLDLNSSHDLKEVIKVLNKMMKE